MPTEAQTRKNLINKHLAAAGWKVSDVTQVIEEFDVEAKVPNQLSEDPAGYTTLFSDYVLLGKDGQPLAMVEKSDLEQALLDHLQQFILEPGNGFCFEARQKRILIGDEYFFIDMVFYHRILECHVLIDSLKNWENNHYKE